MRMCVRYNLYTNICSEVIYMERVTESKTNLLANIMDGYQIARSRPQFQIYPQMPVNQIQHYVKQAARLNKDVTVQLNASPFSNELSEASGKLKLSPTSGHVILSASNGRTVHLIRPDQIRHLRIA